MFLIKKELNIFLLITFLVVAFEVCHNSSAEVLSDKVVGKKIFDLFVGLETNSVFEKKQDNLKKLIRNKEWLRAVKMADKIYQSHRFILSQQIDEQEQQLEISPYHRYCNDFIVWWHQMVFSSDQLLIAFQEAFGKLSQAKLQQARETPYQQRQRILQSIVDRFYFTKAGLQAAIDLGLMAKLKNHDLLVKYYFNKITKHPLYVDISKEQIKWVNQLNTTYHTIDALGKPADILYF